MSTTITVMPNQSMSDVIIMATGSMEAGMQFCMDNDVSVSDAPAVGTVFQVSDAALASGDAGTLQYLAQNGIVIGTLNRAPDLGFEVVLYPVTKGTAQTVVVPPSISSGWFTAIYPDTDFVAVYGIPDVYFPTEPNPMACENVDNIVAGHPYLAVHDQIPATMAPSFGGGTFYTIHYVAAASHMLLWNDLMQNTIQYQDNNGNLAQATPLVVLPANAQTPIDSLQPALTVAHVTGDDVSITLRLTMSHVPAVAAEVGSINLFFVDEATGGTPDPDDPMNTNKCIVVVAAGVHTFGAVGQYVYTDGSTVLGYSLIEMCVEVS